MLGTFLLTSWAFVSCAQSTTVAPVESSSTQAPSETTEAPPQTTSEPSSLPPVTSTAAQSTTASPTSASTSSSAFSIITNPSSSRSTSTTTSGPSTYPLDSTLYCPAGYCGDTRFHQQDTEYMCMYPSAADVTACFNSFCRSNYGASSYCRVDNVGQFVVCQSTEVQCQCDQLKYETPVAVLPDQTPPSGYEPAMKCDYDGSSSGGGGGGNKPIVPGPPGKAHGQGVGLSIAVLLAAGAWFLL